ncbi:HAD family phosphatase [Streptomyces sp. NPDC047130]|uniref:HAD family hydrolase n=1 Tax=Streptomyces sp. NPDC047130 TaxID=3155261 RepID=UPI00340DFDDF
MTHVDPLAEVLAHVEAVFFDFDGPLCDVFAGLPAPQVADELTRLLAAKSAAAGERAAATDDPIEVLRIAHDEDAALGNEVERALAATEVRAVGVAGEPTPGGVAALKAASAAGRKVAVVSNNSADCVRAFLALHSLTEYVGEVVGRPANHPDLMKPNPYLLITAAEQLRTQVAACVLIGDSVTDIEAARAAGAEVIGYANKTDKPAAFAEAGGRVITDDMQSIADALLALRNA